MNKQKIVFIALVVSSVFINACSHKVVSVNSKNSSETSANSIVSVAEGEKTYKTSCGKCHELVNPADFSQKEWIPIMRSMARKAKLDESQKANVTAYVNSLAKK